MVCRQPVALATLVDKVGLFEPGQGSNPHRCPEEALIGWRRKMAIARMGDPRFPK
jgi:hypothetical protein